MAPLRPPNAEEFCTSLMDGGFIYEKEPRLIFDSNSASYYNCNMINYGEITLKVCLSSNQEEVKSFKRTTDLYNIDNAISVVPQPKFSFKFDDDEMICFVYEQFVPFQLGSGGGTGSGSEYLSQAQIKNLKEILDCLQFLINKGCHGRVDDDSVCRVVLCRGKAMVNDVKSVWSLRAKDYKDFGNYLTKMAKSSFGSIPKYLSFLITQINTVTFMDSHAYGYFNEHPLFCLGRKKLVLYMFGITEGEVFIALKAKGKLPTHLSGTPSYQFQKLRSVERQTFRQQLIRNLNIIGSTPSPVTPVSSSTVSVHSPSPHQANSPISEDPLDEYM